MVESSQISEVIHFLDAFEIDEAIVAFVHIQITTVSFLVSEIGQILRLIVGVRLADLKTRIRRKRNEK